MDVNSFQQQARRTLLDAPDFQITDKDIMGAWSAIGLAGEAGEVSELIKKGIFHQHGLDIEKLKKELGDVLWYVAALCSTYGLTMEEVMDANLKKLAARYPDGYTGKDSKNREGDAE